MKATIASAIACIFMCVIFETTLCSARSIRVKRQSTAMHQFNRRRRDLWEAYHRLQIIYERIRSQSSVIYVPTTVERAGDSLDGARGIQLIRQVLGPEYPIVFRKPSGRHAASMEEAVRQSFMGGAKYQSTGAGDVGRIEVYSSTNTNDEYIQLAGSYPENGLILKVLTHARPNGSGRRKQDKTVNEIVHLCQQINNELMSQSLKLKCEVVLDEASR